MGPSCATVPREAEVTAESKLPWPGSSGQHAANYQLPTGAYTPGRLSRRSRRWCPQRLLSLRNHQPTRNNRGGNRRRRSRDGVRPEVQQYVFLNGRERRQCSDEIEPISSSRHLRRGQKKGVFSRSPGRKSRRYEVGNLQIYILRFPRDLFAKGHFYVDAKVKPSLW